MRLTDLDSSLEGGFVYPSKEIAHTCAGVDARVTVVLELLHLLVNLLMTGNIQLEVVVFMLAFALEGMQLFLELPSPMLSETRAKKCDLKFLEGSTDIAGLAKCFDANLCRGLLNNNLELGKYMAESTACSGDLKSYTSSSSSALVLP